MICDLTFILLLFPQYLKLMQKKYKFKQQAKTHVCDENDYIAKSALQYTV